MVKIECFLLRGYGRVPKAYGVFFTYHKDESNVLISVLLLKVKKAPKRLMVKVY